MPTPDTRTEAEKLREAVEGRVVIWSGEHNAYWRKDGCGYTAPGRWEGVWTAGVYDREDAERWTSGCGPEKLIELVPLDNALAIRSIENGTVIAALATLLTAAEVPND